MAKKDKETKKSELACEIMEEYGTLGEDKVYASISWNNRAPKDEVRKVWFDKEGNRQLGKGIDLSKEEIEELHALMKKTHKEPVDFDEIFKSTRGITEKRQAGFRTEDGFIRLHRRGT